jgi:hypothetical protein
MAPPGLGGVAAAGGAGTVGTAICGIFRGTTSVPTFLSAASYLFGLVLGVWGLLKIKDHVLNPQQTPVWEAVSRLMAAGAFFSLPYIVGVIANTMDVGLTGFGVTNFKGTPTGNGLDAMMVKFMADVYGPSLFLTNWFGYMAGAVLLMIGVSRLLKSAQEGPRGPGGLGTLMTFLAGGALLSVSPMLGSFSESLFQNTNSYTSAQLQYTTGMQQAEVDHVHAVISSVLAFMIVLGLISFVRGIFIIREVAEGNSQASLMAGITHLLGGALAVNLGPVMDAVQTTLGLTAYGVNFT